MYLRSEPDKCDGIFYVCPLFQKCFPTLDNNAIDATVRLTNESHLMIYPAHAMQNFGRGEASSTTDNSNNNSLGN